MPRNHTYSQHFLRSPRLVAELIGHSNIRKNDTVYDIGAGSGVITSALARRCRRVVAVEIEPTALRSLHTNTNSLDNVTILKTDILQLSMPTEPYKIFSNIPFHLSAQIIRKFTQAELPPKSMYLITQKQFARKLVPGDTHFTSQLSAEIAPWFSVRIRKPLRKTDFTPPPAVDTVLLEIKPYDAPFVQQQNAEDYQTFIAQSFTSQLYFAKLPRSTVGISPELRPSQLTPKQWVALFNATRS